MQRDHDLAQVMRDPACTLWRGVAADLEAVYKPRVGRTVVFWGFTSTTRSMDALDAFIPVTSPQARLGAPGAGPLSCFSTVVGGCAETVGLILLST